MRYPEAGGEADPRVALVCFALVDQLQGQQIASCRAAKQCGDLPLVLFGGDLNLTCPSLIHRPVGCRDDADTCLINVDQ